MFTSGFCEILSGKAGRILNWVIPQFILGAVDGDTYKKLLEYTETMAHHFGLTNMHILRYRVLEARRCSYTDRSGLSNGFYIKG